MTEQMNVPKLRFGEFDGSWQELHLADVAIIQAGFAYKSIEMSRTPKDYQLIKMSNVYQNELRLDRNPSYWDKVSKSDAKFLMKSGDIVLTLTGTVGKTDFGYTAQIPCDGKFLLNQRLVYLRSIDGVSDPKFLLSKLRTGRFYYKFFAEAKGGTGNQANVGMSELAKIKLSYPFYPEQQKIASFLSKVDEKISLLTEKKDKLAEYKKGVMQQLFNGKWEEQEGQLTFIPPTLRFKADDGSEFPDWEEKKFGDCFDFFTTNSLSRDKLSYDTGMIKNIHYGDIHTKFRSVFKPEQENVPYITDLDDTKKIKAQSYCQNGDLVFADASEDYADIGKCIEVRELGDLKLVAGLHTHLARPKEKFATGYQAYLQKSWKMRYQIMRIAQGTKVLGISTKQLATISLPVPCYEEQEKIASFLISLDSKIECLELELDKSKEWKKGLLQQMFV
ncbi:restriction endonuclease subunit S [Vibrio fluvialis]|nr:restriction endonuclease subunit S [Vibrio fluvialis]